MEKSKYIYETTIDKQIEEKVVEKRQENGQEIEISRTVKKSKPVKVAILKPDRKKYKEAEIFYAKSLSNYLKEGLLPYSLVAKRYMNDGGPLSDDEKKFIDTLRERYNVLQAEYFDMPSPLTDEQTKRRGEIILEMNEINKILKDIQNSYAELYDNTAEVKGKNDTIEWWILNLSYIDQDGTGYTPLYGDGDYQSKLTKLETLENDDNEFINEAIKKLSYFVSFWYSAGNQVSQDDYKSADENYKINVSKYVIETTPEAEAPKAPATPADLPVAAPVAAPVANEAVAVETKEEAVVASPVAS